MTDLILYLGVTAAGYFIGSKLRQRESFCRTDKVQSAAIILLVLCMGMRMGANKEITENMRSIGVSALLITLITMIFSIGAIYITRKALKIDRYGRMEAGAETPDIISKDVLSGEGADNNAGKQQKSGINTMTLFILAATAAGIAIGYFFIRRIFVSNMEVFENAAGMGIKVGLCVLLIFVGIDLGRDGTVVSDFREVGLRVLAVPAAVLAGTLLGAAGASLLVELTLQETLAVGAGMGWYSLAPGIIMEAGHMTAGAVSFLHNVMREMLAILFIPLVADKVGYVETVGMPGSAAMDVCLPIVEKATRSEIAVYSFISGMVLSILVPVLVPLIIG